jgi:glyoxylase-like metal-dependent hydrolase (beta-lactamase superfamily II)
MARHLIFVCKGKAIVNRAAYLSVSLALAMWLFVARANADEFFGMQDDPFAVEIEQLADGVYVARRPFSWRLPVQANVTIVINDEDVVLVDGAGLPAHAEHIIRAIRDLTDKPVSTILTTHWHGDHNLGYSVFRREFPGVRIIAHENTRHSMANGVMDYALGATEEGIPPGIERMKQRAADAEEAGEPAEVVAFWKSYALDYAPQTREYIDIEIVLADETFADRYVLHRGDRTIEFLYVGNANTDGDAIMWLPQEKIVATGDIVVGPTPYGFGSYPGEWGDTLRAVKALDYDILVPGHGDLQRDTAYVDALIALMDDISEQGRAAVAAGVDSEEAVHEAIDFAVHDKAIAGGDPLLQYLFDMWFRQPIIESIYIEATGGTVSQLNE